MEKHTKKVALGEFYVNKDYFVVEDGSKVHGKKDTKRNKGLCNKARVEYYINSIDWPLSSLDLNPIENVWRILKQLIQNRKC